MLNDIPDYILFALTIISFTALVFAGIVAAQAISQRWKKPGL